MISHRGQPPLSTILFRTTGCGCEGLHCYTCGLDLKRGDSYVQVGLTRYCKTCLREALFLLLNHTGKAKGLTHD